MKKHYILIIFILFVSKVSIGQLEKGTWLLSGTVNFSASTITNYPLASGGTKSSTNNLGFGLSPNVGFFVFDRIVIGLSPGFSWNKSGSSSNDQFLIGPFIRYYFLQTDKPINIFTHISDQIGTSHVNNGSSLKSNVNNFTLACGPVIYFNSSVGIEFTIGYAKNKTDIGPTLYTDSQSNFQASIGFQIHL